MSKIELRSILYDSVVDNKSIIISMVALLSAYWLEDVVFPNQFSNFTSDVPGFIKELSISNVGSLIFPYFLAELLFYVNNVIVSHAIPKIELNVVKRITEQAIESVKTSKKTFNTNEFIMNLKKVIEAKSIYYLFISYILPTILVSIGLLYQFFKTDAKVGTVVMAIMIIFFIITFYLEENSVNACYENEESINTFYDNIQDVVANIDNVIVSNTKEKEIENINKEIVEVLGKYVKSETISSDTTFQLHILSLIAISIINGLAFKSYIDGNMSSQLLVSTSLMSILFMNYYNSTISKLRSTVNYIGKFYEINEYFGNFDIKKNNETKLRFIKGDIRFEKICLNFDEKVILKNFNMTVNAGMKIGIVGSVGTGKTSILKMISGLIEYGGAIYIDNQNIKLCNHDSIMKHVAYIPQHPKMFNKTICYNLSYGTNYTQRDIEKFIKDFGFTDFFKKFQDGLNTSVGKEGSKLSGGQKQIIALLRSLIQNKSILLLDEPTSSLDHQTKKMVMSLINDIRGKTILIVTHDSSLDAIFDDVIKM